MGALRVCHVTQFGRFCLCCDAKHGQHGSVARAACVQLFLRRAGSDLCAGPRIRECSCRVATVWRPCPFALVHLALSSTLHDCLPFGPFLVFTLRFSFVSPVFPSHAVPRDRAPRFSFGHGPESKKKAWASRDTAAATSWVPCAARIWVPRFPVARACVRAFACLGARCVLSTLFPAWAARRAPRHRQRCIALLLCAGPRAK